MSIIITGPFELQCFHCGKDLDAQIDLEGNPGEDIKQTIRVKMCEECDESFYWEERAMKAEKLMADFLSMPPAGRES
jgi:N-acetylmuramoyl-L-alanine amidase CwlA